jgi:tight adherence protein B
MGAFLGLLLGLGLLLIWRSGGRAPLPRASQPGWIRRRNEIIKQAGIDGLNSAQLLFLQSGSAVFAGLAVQLITGAVAVAACFAAFGFLAPLGIVRRLRQQRQVALREV